MTVHLQYGMRKKQLLRVGKFNRAKSARIRAPSWPRRFLLIFRPRRRFRYWRVLLGAARSALSKLGVGSVSVSRPNASRFSLFPSAVAGVSPPSLVGTGV